MQNMFDLSALAPPVYVCFDMRHDFGGCVNGSKRRSMVYLRHRCRRKLAALCTVQEPGPFHAAVLRSFDGVSFVCCNMKRVK